MHIRTITALALLSLSACGDDAGADKPGAADAGQPDERPADCVSRTMESDLMFVTPLVGAGVDPATSSVRPPEPGTSYMVGVTYLQLLPGQESGQKMTELTQPIQAQLATQPGLLAAQIALSERCRTARTLTVWRDEQALVEFVASPAHLEAMRQRNKVMSASASNSFEAAQADQLTWGHALGTLEEAR